MSKIASLSRTVTWLSRGTAGAMALAQLALAALPAEAATDLSAYLAKPPTSDWIENGPSENVLSGPFTASSYAAYVEGPAATPGNVASNLTRNRFVGGYGREWEQRTTLNYLVERVFQFADSTGARSWFNGIKTESLTSKAYRADFPTAGTVPLSFGVVLNNSDGSTQWRIDFVHGNLVFVVHADAITDNLEQLALSQAKTEYGGAAGTSAPAASNNAASLARVAAIGLVAVVLVIIVAVVIVVAITARGRRPATVAAGLQMSPDGAYWWDGARWRDARHEVPPNAQRSPDGAYWWDGATWRQSG